MISREGLKGSLMLYIGGIIVQDQVLRNLVFLKPLLDRQVICFARRLLFKICSIICKNQSQQEDFILNRILYVPNKKGSLIFQAIDDN